MPIEEMKNEIINAYGLEHENTRFFFKACENKKIEYWQISFYHNVFMREYNNMMGEDE